MSFFMNAATVRPLFFGALLGSSLLSPRVVFAAQCLNPVPVSRLQSVIIQAEEAVASLRPMVLMQQLSELDALLPCVLPLSKDEVIRLHWVMAIRAFSADEDAHVLESLLAYRELNPSGAFPGASVFPEDHPLAIAFRSLPLKGQQKELLRAPRQGQVLIDGDRSNQRSLSRASFVQLTQPKLGSASSAYLYTDSEVFDYPMVQEKMVGRYSLVAGSALSLGTSLMFFSRAAQTETTLRFDNQCIDEACLLALRSKNHRQAALGGLFGALSAASAFSLVVLF